MFRGPRSSGVADEARRAAAAGSQVREGESHSQSYVLIVEMREDSQPRTHLIAAGILWCGSLRSPCSEFLNTGKIVCLMVGREQDLRSVAALPVCLAGVGRFALQGSPKLKSVYSGSPFWRLFQIVTLYFPWLSDRVQQPFYTLDNVDMYRAHSNPDPEDVVKSLRAAQRSRVRHL